MSHWVPLYICSDRPDVASLATEKAETAEDKNGLRRVVRSHLLGLPSRNWGPFPRVGDGGHRASASTGTKLSSASQLRAGLCLPTVEALAGLAAFSSCWALLPSGPALAYSHGSLQVPGT